MQVTDKKILTQGSQEWLDFRRDKIGGSDIAVVMEASPYKSAFQLWQEKKGLKDPPPMNDAMRLGVELEPIARKAYEFESGNEMQPSVHIHDYFTQFMASLDGINFDGNKITEIKCGKKAYQQALVGIIDETYKMQCQWNMGVSGAKKCDFYAYDTVNRSGGKIITLDFNPSFFQKMVKKAEEFIESLSKDAPPGYKKIDCSDDLKFLVQRRNIYKKHVEDYKALLDKVETELIALADEENMLIENLRIHKINRSGTISYKKAIDELLPDADLEKYRGNGTSYYKIDTV